MRWLRDLPRTERFTILLFEQLHPKNIVTPKKYLSFLEGGESGGYDASCRLEVCNWRNHFLAFLQVHSVTEQ